MKKLLMAAGGGTIMGLLATTQIAAPCSPKKLQTIAASTNSLIYLVIFSSVSVQAM